MGKMKGGFVNSQQLRGSLEDSKVDHKYQNLLEDYLELHKEYDSKKKKLQLATQKREILQDEVWFLRQRHKYLMKSQFSKVESEVGLHQNADTRDAPIRKKRNHIVNESYKEQKGSVTKQRRPLKIPCVEKKSKNCLNNENKSRKRNISWRDKVDLKV